MNAYIVGIHVAIPQCLSPGDFAQILELGAVVTPDAAALSRVSGIAWQTQEAHDFCRAIKIPTLYEFDRKFFGITAADAVLMDPQQRKLLESVHHCFYNAGLNLIAANADSEVACYVGAGVSNYLRVCGKKRANYFSEETRDYITNDIGALALRTSYFLDLRGPSFSILSTCSSSLVAFCQAAHFVDGGQGNFAIAAGVHVDFETGRFTPEVGGILSPTGGCRPLSLLADGTFFSNGICVALLASESAVRRFGLTPYCQVNAAKVNNDGRSKNGYTAPSFDQQTRVVINASRAAMLQQRPEVIELHGTGTKLGDPIELNALSQAYKTLQLPGKSSVGSVKSNFGHLSSAAGMLGVAKAALMLKRHRCFRTVNCIPLLDTFDFEAADFIPAVEEKPLSDEAQCAVSSFGIGGTNAHVVLSSVSSERRLPVRERSAVVILIGSHALDLLERQTAMLLLDLKSADIHLDNLCYTCGHLFKGDKYQSLLVYDAISQVATVLMSVKDMSFSFLPRGSWRDRGAFLQEVKCYLEDDSLTDRLVDVRVRHQNGEYSFAASPGYSLGKRNAGGRSKWITLLTQLLLALGPDDKAVDVMSLSAVTRLQKAFHKDEYIYCP